MDNYQRREIEVLLARMGKSIDEILELKSQRIAIGPVKRGGLVGFLEAIGEHTVSIGEEEGELTDRQKRAIGHATIENKQIFRLEEFKGYVREILNKYEQVGIPVAKIKKEIASHEFKEVAASLGFLKSLLENAPIKYGEQIREHSKRTLGHIYDDK